MQKRLEVFAALGILSLLSSLSQAPDRSFLRPLAIDKLADGSLYILDYYRRVHALDFVAGTPKVTGSFYLQGLGDPISIVSAETKGQRVLFVGRNLMGSGFATSGGAIEELTVEGKPITNWNLRGRVGGLDYDPANLALYVASSPNVGSDQQVNSALSPLFSSGLNPTEIYRIDVSEHNSAHYIADIRGSTSFGPLVYDRTANALITADVADGTLYKLDLATKKSTALVHGLKSPQALLLAEDAKSVYIAESLARRIRRLSIKDPEAKPTTFAAIPQFSSPSGLAYFGDYIAVSDDGADCLLFLSKTGSLVSTVPECRR